MIWIPQSSNEQRRDSLIAHIADTIADTSLDDFLVDSTRAEAFAAAVAAFVEDEIGPECAVTSGYLVMLASQAMSSVGAAEEARRMLVFGSGLVRPAEWEVTGGEDVWTIDLHQMTVAADCQIELIFFNALTMVVESIAEVWDRSRGRGVLGLRHVCDTARVLLGGRPEGEAVDGMIEEIKAMCNGRLGQLRTLRDWDATPVVMNLDI